MINTKLYMQMQPSLHLFTITVEVSRGVWSVQQTEVVYTF